MDHVDRQDLVQTIIMHIKKYDNEGRRCDLDAEEAVTYAKTIIKFIEEKD